MNAILTSIQSKHKAALRTHQQATLARSVTRSRVFGRRQAAVLARYRRELATALSERSTTAVLTRHSHTGMQPTFDPAWRATSNGSTMPAALSHLAGHPAPGQRLRATRTSGGMTVTSRSYQHRKIHWSSARSESRAHQDQNDVYECGCGRDCQEDSQPHGGRPTLNCLAEYRPAIRGSHRQENAVIPNPLLRTALT